MIRVLPPEVVNQIAAGEVVERPFSVVKELVENSLDAGAQRVHVALVDGGRASIRVTDDGAGFTPKDLELAFISHATSKLSSVGDLDHIASLGFRGEALASIGSVSRTRIRSRTAKASSGHEVRCEGGKIRKVKPASCPPGTVIEVADLFFNTPARRRFLKTPRAERARIQELLSRLGLARPDVDFTLEVDGKDVLRLPAGEALQARIGRVLGRTAAEAMHEVQSKQGKMRVVGFTTDPDDARRDSTQELLYINGRLAKDRSSQFAIRQAYKEFLMGGRYPGYVLMLSLPPDQVDVNVHPTKSEVRFLDARKVNGFLHDAVRTALAGRAREEFTAEASGLSIGADKPRARTGFPAPSAGLFETRPAADRPRRSDPTPPLTKRGGSSSVREPSRPNPFVDAAERRFLQVADLYLVYEGDDGEMVVVDQHALHERVMYERLKAQHDARGGVAVQQMLVPEIVEVSPVEKAYLLDARDVLADEGFSIDDFGGDAIAITGIPAVLTRTKPHALLRSFLDGGDGDLRPKAKEAIRERFHSMACRGAIMSGDRLDDAEITALLEEAATLEHPHNCPHGRPTVLRFSAGELERFFRRKI